MWETALKIRDYFLGEGAVVLKAPAAFATAVLVATLVLGGAIYAVVDRLYSSEAAGLRGANSQLDATIRSLQTTIQNSPTINRPAAPSPTEAPVPPQGNVVPRAEYEAMVAKVSDLTRELQTRPPQISQKPTDKAPLLGLEAEVNIIKSMSPSDRAGLSAALQEFYQFFDRVNDIFADVNPAFGEINKTINDGSITGLNMASEKLGEMTGKLKTVGASFAPLMKNGITMIDKQTISQLPTAIIECCN